MAVPVCLHGGFSTYNPTHSKVTLSLQQNPTLILALTLIVTLLNPTSVTCSDVKIVFFCEIQLSKPKIRFFDYHI